MNKFFVLLVVALALSTQAMAHIELSTKKTCTAQYGEGYSWMEVEIVKNAIRICPRCNEGFPQFRINAKVSVPYGPRGSYITQNYAHTSTQHYRLSESLFKKVGSPIGPLSDQWGEWFPQEMVILSGSSDPLFIYFKEELLELDCKLRVGE